MKTRKEGRKIGRKLGHTIRIKTKCFIFPAMFVENPIAYRSSIVTMNYYNVTHVDIREIVHRPAHPEASHVNNNQVSLMQCQHLDIIVSDIGSVLD